MVFDTPEDIALYRLVVLKSSLSLQAQTGSHIGPSPTMVGKRDYGLVRNTSRAQLAVVAPVVEAILQFRECAPALQEHIGRALAGAINHCTDEDWPVNRRNLDRALRHEDLTPAELRVAVGLADVYLFEQNAKPAVRVVFRA